MCIIFMYMFMNLATGPTADHFHDVAAYFLKLM